MGMRRPAESRWFPRYHDVTGQFPGRLLREASGHGFEELSARVVDVGRDGIGILTTAQLDAGSTLQLELADRLITLAVVYCHEDLIHKGSYRCGLQRTGSTENLVSLFAASGCIRI